MADDQAQDRPSAEPQTPVNNPHDKYFFDVFSASTRWRCTWRSTC